MSSERIPTYIGTFLPMLEGVSPDGINIIDGSLTLIKEEYTDPTQQALIDVLRVSSEISEVARNCLNLQFHSEIIFTADSIELLRERFGNFILEPRNRLHPFYRNVPLKLQPEMSEKFGAIMVASNKCLSEVASNRENGRIRQAKLGDGYKRLTKILGQEGADNFYVLRDMKDDQFPERRISNALEGLSNGLSKRVLPLQFRNLGNFVEERLEEYGIDPSVGSDIRSAIKFHYSQSFADSSSRR